MVQMFRRPAAFLLASALAASLLPRATAGQRADQESSRVDSLFAEYNRGLSPGLAIAVVRDGKVLLTRGYGYANLEQRVRITPATVFDIASVSKQFAGLSVALLIAEGKVKLGDDIRKYIPELGDVGSTVTVDHLLHHTSGYRDWPGVLSLAGWRMDDVISFEVAAYNSPMTFQSVNGQPVQLTYRGRRLPRLDETTVPSPEKLREFVGDYESPELQAQYRVELSGNSLVMKHRRHGTINLTHLWRDDFNGSVWFLQSVEFQRDPSGRVIGFTVTIDERSRDVRFLKRP
jgi:beta-lactamase family protein